MTIALRSSPAFEPSPYKPVRYAVSVSGRPVPVGRLWPDAADGSSRTLLSIQHASAVLPLPGAVLVGCGERIEDVEIAPAGSATGRVEEDRLVLHFLRAAKIMVRLNGGEPLFLIVRAPDVVGGASRPARTVLLSDHAADPTGMRSSTEALQRAIDEAGGIGPGATVRVGAGTYLTGSLWMRDGVTLHLEEGAELRADPDDLAFPARDYERSRSWHHGTDPKTQAALLWFDGVCDAGLSGCGVINGRGHARRSARAGGERLRINLVRVRDSRNVRLSGCRLVDSEFWAVHLLRGRDIVASDLTILNEMPLPGWDAGTPESCWNNTDGIVADACLNVLVEDVLLHTGDDCLVVKTTNSGPFPPPSSENIVFRNAVLASSTSAVKLGTESIAEGMRNVIAEDIHILAINRSRGLVIWPRDVAAIENIVFRRIRIDGPGHWLQVDVGPRVPGQSRLATVDNVIFEDIGLSDSAGGFIRTAGSPDVFGRLRFRRITRRGSPVETPAGLRVAGLVDIPGVDFS